MLTARETGVDTLCIHRFKRACQHGAVTFAESHRCISIELTIGEDREINSSLSDVDTNRITRSENIFGAHAFQRETARTYISKHGLHERHTLLGDGPLSRSTFCHDNDITKRDANRHRGIKVMHSNKMRTVHELSTVAGAVAHVLINRQGHSDACIDDQFRRR